jgi:hypothetical protein
VPFEMVRYLPGGLAVKFDEESETRRKMIEKLFTGGYRNEIGRVRFGDVLLAIGKKLFT